MKKNDRRKRKLQEEACDYEIERTPTTRYEPDYEEGLTSAQAEEHRCDGWGNISVDPPAQTTEEIIKENVFTYFNLIFLVLAILLTIVGSFRNLTFLPVIIFNTLIGIIQEIRSKKTLEKLNMLNAPHATVVRDGKTSRVNSENLVLDDIVIFKAGNQVCADAEVVHGSVQVNESLLTGESDEITKNPGDHLMSGSFIVAGECHARLDAVGVDSYISKLTLEAKAMQKGEQSEMIRSLDKLVKFVGIALIPIGIILFVQSFFFNGDPFRSSITSMVAAVIGMIPEGLYLLASVAMAVSAMRLAKQKVLLHDMKSIETLARVDVLCVDKTGTITEPDMKVSDIFLCQSGSNPAYNDQSCMRENSLLQKQEQAAGHSELSLDELKKLIVRYAYASKDNNATMLALKEYAEGFVKTGNSGLKIHNSHNDITGRIIDQQAFSSSRKYGSITFADGTYLLGAPEFILGDDFHIVENEIQSYTEKGDRVLLFARRDSDKTIPLGFVALANPIRQNAVKTFEYFKKQRVAIKVISGDNPKTVSQIAMQAGIENADKYIDAASLDSKEKIAKAVSQYTVFGRVTPKQKQQLVKALQQKGHTVAMTGDGVNDILAMKDADCSVAMASGSEAAAQAAQVVLLDSDFVHMPDVVYEGRRVVNNIERSASLFLVKNIFSLLLALFSVISMFTYPLEPSQISLISMFTIGLPGFLLAMEPNKERIRGHFLTNVMLKALPGGLTDVIAISALVVCGAVFSIPEESIGTIATMVLSVVGFMILFKISEPLNTMKYVVIGINVAGFVLCVYFLKDLFALTNLSSICILLMIVFGFAAESLFRNLTVLEEKLREGYKRRIKKKR